LPNVRVISSILNANKNSFFYGFKNVAQRRKNNDEKIYKVKFESQKK